MQRPGMRASAVGIAWYKRVDYPRILAIMEDRELLPETFDKWQRQAEDLERKTKASGMVVVRAQIDPEHFVAWCAGNGLNVDAKAPMRWGAEAARLGLDGQH